jgi:hypothetical protein
MSKHLMNYVAMLGAMSPELFSVDATPRHDGQWFKKYRKKRGVKRNKPRKRKR